MKASGYNLSSTCSTTWVKINLNTGSALIVNSSPDEWLKTFWKEFIYTTKIDENDNYTVIKRSEKDFFKE